MDNAEKVAALGVELERLILEWEKFFSGERRVPPALERERLARRFHNLTEHGLRSSAAQFRLEQLQNRFMTYSQLWERLLRQREEGRQTGAPARRPLPAAPNAGGPATVDRPGERGSLYDRYVAAKRLLGQAVNMDREAFEGKMARQRVALEKRLGGEVRFDVLVQDDKVKLAARGKNRKGNGG